MKHRFIIIGMDDSRSPFFPPEVPAQIRKGKFFSGGIRHKEIVAPLLPAGAEWIPVTVPLDRVFSRYEEIFARFEETAADDSILVFASGDPLFFGFANTIKRKLPDAEIRLYPAFNSLQALAHRLVMPYDDMRTVSLTGRPWQEFDRALIEHAPKIGVLTDREHTPATIAARMLEYGYSYYIMYIGEHLGHPEKERIRQMTLREAAAGNFEYPNCLLLNVHPECLPSTSPECLPSTHPECLPSTHPECLPDTHPEYLPGTHPECLPDTHPECLPDTSSECLPDTPSEPCHTNSRHSSTQAPNLPPRPFGIPDEAFAHLDGRTRMITKAPIRLLTLQALELNRRRVFWDIGFCTGSVSIEARLQFPHLTVISFEIRPEGKELMDTNSRRFGAPGITAVIGDFLQTDIGRFPRPDAVFIGGHGGHLEEMIEKVKRVLQPGGCIVFNSVSAESKEAFRQGIERNGMALHPSLRIALNDYNPIEIMKAALS